MTNQRYSISAIFPAYNEEKNIKQTVITAIDVLNNYSNDFEIIVVNDGSKDNTSDILNELSKICHELKVIHHIENKGYGSALISGFMAAEKELIFFSDSDLQFDLKEISLLLPWIGTYEIVAGYRKNRKDPLNRRLNAGAWNILMKILLGLKVKDINCAFKLFKRVLLKKIKLESDGAFINTELLSMAIKNGFTIKEIPVSHFPRISGKQTGANLKVVFNAFSELLNLYKKIKWLKES